MDIRTRFELRSMLAKTLHDVIPTLLRLGLAEVLTVGIYKLALRTGLLERLCPPGQSYADPLFQSLPIARPDGISEDSQRRTLAQAQAVCQGTLTYFAAHQLQGGSPPNWFRNPFKPAWIENLAQQHHYPNASRHWSRLPDFDPLTGDIKCIWEASRWDWALTLARAYRLTGDARFCTTLHTWTSDWIAQNPLNLGPNWKCGQETAIRMMQTLLAAYILEQHQSPMPGLIRFVREHCQRIAPTIRYAIAQNNNHGVSEAAGLYLGGGWLLTSQTEQALRTQALRWHRMGKTWLENRVQKLIAAGGGFAQYSLNYHRLVLDTLNIVEFWRRELSWPEFSAKFYERAQAAVNWLYQMTEPNTGDGPNVGANDGAHLFALAATDYRDYRPTVQLGSVLFLNRVAYPDDDYDEPLHWLKLPRSVSVPQQPLAKTSIVMRDGGYVMMSFPASWAVIRFPHFRFRPAHADALHLDLWCNGMNLLRDSGSYSYHTDESWQHYFSSTAAHNTVQFDDRDQMPRISRFLFGHWLKIETLGDLTNENGWLTWVGSYRDYQGCWHKRTVASNGLSWKCIDEIADFKKKGVLRWRLAPGEWTIQGTMCRSALATLTVASSVPIARCELTKGWESRYYMEKTTLPVLEIEVPPGHATLTTEIHLNG